MASASRCSAVDADVADVTRPFWGNFSYVSLVRKVSQKPLVASATSANQAARRRTRAGMGARMASVTPHFLSTICRYGGRVMSDNEDALITLAQISAAQR
jgi:hypothetical protein